MLHPEASTRTRRHKGPEEGKPTFRVHLASPFLSFSLSPPLSVSLPHNKPAMSGRKGSLASRSLEYRAPETPNFLKALKAQVASSDRYAPASRRGGAELDSFVTSTSSGKRKAQDDEEGLDSEDEMNGAQVVVLKDGKHLSHQEAMEIKKGAAAQVPTSPPWSSKDKAQNIASTGSGVSKRRREAVNVPRSEQKEASISAIVEEKNEKDGGGKIGGLEDVKQLIRQDRESRAPPKAKEPTKEDKRKEKNAQARKLKAKSGKGLSFDLDD